MKSPKKLLGLLAAIGIISMSVGEVRAATLPYFGGTYPTPNSACATFGNFVSCSTAVLEYLGSQSTPGFTAGSYSFATSQGHLLDTIVLATNGGNITDNGDAVTPSEDAFKTITPQKNYFFTGDGNDPTNNGALTGDTAFSWDIGLGSLISKLTFDNAFHQMLVGLDFNNPQNSTASIPLWTLVTIRDTDGNLTQKNFEIQNLDFSNPPASLFKDPSSFVSTKTFSGTGVTTPNSTDFAMTVGAVCVVSNLISYPSPNGSSCPDGGTLVNTNRASNELEFINYLPSLDLKALFAQGYDTMSVQVWMGCFGQTQPKIEKIKGVDTVVGTEPVPGTGPALADGGFTQPCDTGGFGDIFLMAGGATPEVVPEPGSLALAGLGLIALVGLRRRRTH